MAFFRVGVGQTTEMSTLDDDVSAIIGEYSIPNMADIASESLLTKSQYAKVIFHDLLPCYPTDADIWCRYSLTEGIMSQHGDRVALFRVGWISVHEHVQFEMAPITENGNEKEFQVLFKAEALPKDTTEFYQLCYVNVDDAVCGASVPFQFRHPVEEELCEVEEQGGLMVVRSRTAINGEKLRDAAKMIDELESEKLLHKEKIHALESTKDSLSIKLEELSSIKKHEAKLHEDIHELENKNIQAITNLQKADVRIQTLCENVESLTKENNILTELLRTESQKALVSNEVPHYKLQIDNMQQMLDALMQSKEMASQALRCEQSKVMTLNIEHDKYKFRAQHLEEENKGLQIKFQESENEIESLRQRVQQIDTLLQLKVKEYDGVASKLQPLIKRIGQMQFDVTESRDRCESLQLVLRQRDNQILMLEMELKELFTKGNGFDKLNEEYTNLKHQVQYHAEVQAKVESLAQDNNLLRNETVKLREEVKQLHKCREEKERLSSEFEQLSVSHVALQNELYNSTMNNGNIQELQEQNAALQSRLQQLHTQQTEVGVTVTSIKELKHQLSVAEESNSSLMQELEKIRVLQPDWRIDRPKSGSAHTSTLSETVRNNVGNTTTSEASGGGALLQHMQQSLLEGKMNLNGELKDVVSQEYEYKLRFETVIGRLLEIEGEIVAAKSELDRLIAGNRRDKDDLLLINSRMASVQQQLLRDDQIEGRDFHDNADQDRLERMSKRCHDLQCSFNESTTRIHDLQQNIQVLDQERESLDEELKTKPWIEKRMAEDKCNILEKLVALDQELITVGEDLFKKSEAELMKKSCFDLTEGYLLVENAQSCELSSANQDLSFYPLLEDAIIPEERKIRVAYNAGIVEGGVEVLTAAGGNSSDREGNVGHSEPIEKAVETGVLEGLIHGLNTLKQQAAANLSVDSINSSTESLSNVEQKCALAEQVCQEKEKVLEQNLAVILTDSVRKELIEGMMGVDAKTTAGTRDVDSDLKRRLELAAEEYSKIYMQKLKLEKQLAKVQQKQAAASAQTPLLQTSSMEISGFVCPICGVSFSSTQSDTFTRHFEDHLS